MVIQRRYHHNLNPNFFIFFRVTCNDKFTEKLGLPEYFTTFHRFRENVKLRLSHGFARIVNDFFLVHFYPRVMLQFIRPRSRTACNDFFFIHPAPTFFADTRANFRRQHVALITAAPRERTVQLFRVENSKTLCYYSFSSFVTRHCVVVKTEVTERQALVMAKK